MGSELFSFLSIDLLIGLCCSGRRLQSMEIYRVPGGIQESRIHLHLHG